MMNGTFKERLNKVCDLHPEIPAVGEGRQIVIAKKMGVSQGAVRKWLTGESEPSSKKMQELADMLDVSFIFLATGHIQDPDRVFMLDETNEFINAVIEKDSQKNSTVEVECAGLKAEFCDSSSLDGNMHIQFIRGDKDFDALRMDILDGGTHAYLSMLRDKKFHVGWNKKRKCYTAIREGGAYYFTVSSCRLVVRPRKEGKETPHNRKAKMAAGVPFNRPFAEDVRSVLAIKQIGYVSSIAWDFVDVTGLQGKHDVIKEYEAGLYSINDTEYKHEIA